MATSHPADRPTQPGGRTSVRRSTIAGTGAFADVPLAADEVVGAFAGLCVNGHGLIALAAGELDRCVQIDDDLYLVDEPSSLAAMNHSCAPNCVLRGQVVVVARRPIAAGEELTLDYATRNGSDDDEFECACGAPDCRGKVTGHDWMLPELRVRYGNAFSPYLGRRLGVLVDASASRRAYAY